MSNEPSILDVGEARQVISALLLIIESASENNQDSLHEYAVKIKTNPESSLKIGNTYYRYEELVDLVLRSDK
jgi:hypothetical protein